MRFHPAGDTPHACCGAQGKDEASTPSHHHRAIWRKRPRCSPHRGRFMLRRRDAHRRRNSCSAICLDSRFLPVAAPPCLFLGPITQKREVAECTRTPRLPLLHTLILTPKGDTCQGERVVRSLGETGVSASAPHRCEARAGAGHTYGRRKASEYRSAGGSEGQSSAGGHPISGRGCRTGGARFVGGKTGPRRREILRPAIRWRFWRPVRGSAPARPGFLRRMTPLRTSAVPESCQHGILLQHRVRGMSYMVRDPEHPPAKRVAPVYHP